MPRSNLILAIVLLCFAAAGPTAVAEPRVVETIDVAPVWAGHPVAFALLTHAPQQFVAFYDANRRMTVASRPLDSQRWTFQVLPSTVGWDSHNASEMAIDDDGQLHVTGNMHAVPLVYFRTTRAGDVTSLERVAHMVGDGALERRVTYPRFLRGPANELIFTYRDGFSGSGNQIFNVYNGPARQWRRLLDQPLTDGQGKMNAYPVGPTRGPDGFFHLVWVWRDTPDCRTNHTLSYARSRDLRSWETSGGKPLVLPITIETGEVIDDVPIDGGMLNGNTMIGFDSQKRITVSYHKFDRAGNTQLYNARLEDGRWRIYQTSDWEYRWAFAGNGTIGREIDVGPVRVGAVGALTQSWRHVRYGTKLWQLDETTLKPIETLDPPPAHPAGLSEPESNFPGLAVRWQSDAGASPDPKVRYELRWETLPTNRDQPRPKPWPPATMLRLYGFTAR
jgi:hypothetical protein